MPNLEFHADLGENYFDPYDFVDAATHAEKLGYTTAWFGDHFVPWFHSGKKSSFVWSVMSVALEKTSSIRVGPFVTTPIGGRYHPASVAQASATIDNMYPGRFVLGVGTGEAINERPFFNGHWPAWTERIDRLTEGLTLIRRLWESQEPFSFDGKYFKSDFFHLYTKPKTKIPVFFSAVGKNAAYKAGQYGDHLVTLSRAGGLNRIRDTIIPPFKRGCEDSGRKIGKVVVSLNVSLENPKELWAKSRKEFGYVTRDAWSVKTPLEVEARGDALTVEDLKDAVYFCKDWKEAVGVVEQCQQIGANAVVLGTGLDKRLMEQYAANILSAF